MNRIICLLFVLNVCWICYSENDSFVATRDWQEIRDGQSIPPGLHVRINLQTGRKEAKLLSEEEKGGKHGLSTLPENTSEAPASDSDSKILRGNTKQNLKLSETLAIKNIPKETLGLEYSPEKLEKMKHSFRSYSELKREFKDLQMNFKSDAEIISQLIIEFKNLTKLEENFAASAKTTDLARIMDNFNYLVHQIDNAIWFIDEGGLDTVLLPIIVNQTNGDMRVQAMRILGALTQNNRKAKVKVFEKNFGSHLSQLILSSTNTDELSTALYAFGSLLRKFPYAQREILSKSGTQALVTAIGKECELKIKAKAATLISDLITEKELAVKLKNKSNIEELAAAEYKQLHFSEWLHANDYCETLDAAISSKLYELLEEPFVTEYFTQALHTTMMICSERWSQSPQLRHTLLTLKNRYHHSKEEYRIEVAQAIERLTMMLYSTGSSLKDEL